jgi:hypothetical protein
MVHLPSYFADWMFLEQDKEAKEQTAPNDLHTNGDHGDNGDHEPVNPIQPSEERPLSVM